MRKPLLLLALAAAASSLTGCSSSQSTDIATHGVYADLSFTSDGTGSTAGYAALKVGGATSNDFLDLTGGDVLTASNGSAAGVTMSRQQALGAVWYTATFAVSSSATAFKIAFDRTATGNVSAPDSHVTLPEPFAITAPAASASFSRATDPIALTWSGSGQADPMTWIATGDCIVAQTGAIPADSGTYSIAAGSLQPSAGNTGASCQVTLTVARTRAGTLDPAYGEGGVIAGKQVRAVTVLSAP